MILWPWLIFTLLLGGAVGSFLNVVIYRLPAGQSLIHPPSTCPSCSHRLAWYDNVPVLGWLWLKGRCRYCQAPISPQYPLIEAFTALLFAFFFWLFYMTSLRPAFAGPGLEHTWLIFLVYLFMIGGLIAATLIDARYFIIPLSIPWSITVVALICLPLTAGMFPQSVVRVDPAPTLDRYTVVAPSGAVPAVEPYTYAAEVRVARTERRIDPVTVSALPLATSPAAVAGTYGAMLGLIGALVLLMLGYLPRSFEEADPEADLPEEATRPDDPEAFLAHPHPRRETLKECLFLAFPVLGAIIFIASLPDLAIGHVLASRVLQTITGVLLGYLVGGVTVWAVRILGTLAFGKEAMGLGDVHLLAAIGAVAGWRVAVIAFFIAPFFGLAYTLIAQGIGKLVQREVKIIPYGPHLAVGTLAVLVFREPLMAYFGILLGL